MKLLLSFQRFLHRSQISINMLLASAPFLPRTALSIDEIMHDVFHSESLAGRERKRYIFLRYKNMMDWFRGVTRSANLKLFLFSS